MNVLPPALNNLIEAFGNLPGVGPRSAERFAYYVLKSNPKIATQLIDALLNIQKDIDYCTKTFALIEKGEKLSNLYSDNTRDKTIVAIVAEPFDIVAIENTGNFKGTYHVLGGLISPIDGVNPDDLRLKELIKRIDDDKVTELILATNASVEGESTAMYIQKQIGNRKVKITRLARGLPVGVDLEYTDQVTLSRALEGRTLL